MKIHRWKRLERHALCADYDEIKGDDWQEWLDEFKKHGNIDRRPVVMHEGKILDGWNLYRMHVEYNVKPRFTQKNANISPEDFVKIKNDLRRHETPEVIEKRRIARMEKVAELRKAGESLRSIADTVKVSTAQVDRDLKEVEAKTGRPARGTKTTGKDGKTYESAAVINEIKCPRCTRFGQPVRNCQACEDLRAAARFNKTRKPGQVHAYDWRNLDGRLKAIANIHNEIGGHFKEKSSSECQGLGRLLDELVKLVTKWRARLLTEHK